MAYNPRNPVKQSSQSQSTLLEVRVNCTYEREGTYNDFASDLDYKNFYFHEGLTNQETNDTKSTED